jgi:hypothetical protein
MASRHKFPLRRPLILTHEELLWLIQQVSERRDDLSRFIARGQKGQRRLRNAVAFLGRLQKKLFNV